MNHLVKLVNKDQSCGIT